MDFLIHWPPGPVVTTVQCQGLMLDICQYLLDETVKAVGPFYLVSMPGGSKISQQSAQEFFLFSKPPEVCLCG